MTDCSIDACEFVSIVRPSEATDRANEERR